tara:strand:+ start:50 stop:307 length:258 start_codon:yes stop_codon:yes gene_type:complete
MTWNNIIGPLMSIFLLITLTNGQDTLSVDTIKKDTLYLGYDSMKVQEDCYDMKVEQRQMNTELKKQLDFLNNILDEEEEKKDPPE